MSMTEAHYQIRFYSEEGEELRVSGEPSDAPVYEIRASIFEALALISSTGLGWIDWDDAEAERAPVAVVELRHFQPPLGRGVSWQCNLLERFER
ncbi:hypothetical protein [Streptomyces sp. NPDC007063]|uniref:hypothetical protein n=1 Tax=Streptomyces sp. NPDC007063 TaxID=3364772 RepID=UPI0036BD53C6